MHRYYLSIFFLLVWTINSFGQSADLTFDHITSENGLPQSTIHGITKDKYGFMWFGTWSGLCRYDGYRFKIYRYEQGNPRSINSNRIHNIIKDRQQNIWIQTFDENFLCKYNYETDDFERIPINDISSSFFKSISHREHYLNVTYTFKDLRWNLDSYTNSLVETRLSTGESKHYSSNPGIPRSLNDAYVTDLYLDDQQILWVGTYSNGINKSNLKAKPFHYFYHDPNSTNSIIDNNVRTLCEDLSGNLWVGTRDKGITVISAQGSYRHFKHDDSDAQSIKSDQIKNIYCDSKGTIWIGTKKGLDRYQPTTGKIKYYVLSPSQYISVYGITEDHRGDILFATWNGLYKYLVQHDSIVHIDPTTTLTNKHAWFIMEDSQKQLWVGTEGGGISVLRKNQSGQLSPIHHFQHDHRSINSISDNRIYSIFEDSSHYFWIGTGNGLDRYDPKNNKFRHFSTTPNGLAHGMITGIIEDDKGFIWVSHKRGISQINKQTFTIRNYAQQDGLQSNEFAEGAIFKSRSSPMLYFGGSNGYNTFYPDSIQPNHTVPQIVLTELQILNKPVEVNQQVNGRVLLKKPLYLTDKLDLTYRDKSIAIEFAGLHYTNPDGNKYAYKLEGFDKDWIYTDASRRVATYSNLSPGTYHFKVKASNSDGIWNPIPRTLEIEVTPAIWASTWAYVVYTLIFIAILYTFYYYTIRYARLNSKLTYEALLREKEHELHESKVQFFTNISHEIKTPLSLILAPIQQLKSYTEEHPFIQKQLQTMEGNGDRLLKLVNQLLDIRRFETGNEQLMLEQKDMAPFIQNIVRSFDQMAQIRNISLTLSQDVPSLFIRFDPDKMEKVLNNLLSNSFKFTPDGGKIEVRLTHDEEHQPSFALLEVHDNGIGIPEEDLTRIFSPFQQGNDHHLGGSGLGLAYSKLLVELHGGTISVYSNTTEDGKRHTCFGVQIPITIDNTASSEHMEQKKENTGAASDRPLLLLVDDHDEMRRYLRNFFEQQYDVIEAPDGVTGLQLAIKYLPHIILSDVMMPNMDGFSFCKRVKEHLLTSHIPIILLTARSPIQYKIEGMEIGADDYITKPFNLTLLALKIRNLLADRRKMQEKWRSSFIIEPSSFQPVSPDEKLLKKVLDYIEECISDPNLSVETICDQIGLSRTQLYRKMKALTGSSMVDIIKEFRLKRAQQLLKGKKFQVNEVCYIVGFKDSDYFRKCFKYKFGFSPSEYSKQTSKLKDVNNQS